MTETETSDFDWWTLLIDPDYLANPHPHLKRLREIAPIHHDKASDIWFVLGYDAFAAMVRAPEMGRDTRLWNNGWNRPESQDRDPLSYQLFSEFQKQMVNSNPPDHRRMRDIYEKAFRPAVIPALAPMVEQECQQLLDQVPVGESFDFMTGFANHLPLCISRGLFDIPPEMGPQLATWNGALIRIGDILMSQDEKQDALDALRGYKRYLKSHLEARRNNPGADYLDLALDAWDKGIMDEEETLNNLKGLVSGNETTVNVLGNGLLSLLRNPDQLEKLRNDPDQMRTAVEEILRYEPSINFILRVAIEDFHYEDKIIPKGSLALGLIGAVNRDPEKFPHPDDFDISRRPNAQLIFGGGAHVCIGATLARLQIATAFRMLLDRFPTIELTGDPVWWSDRTNQRGLQTLPVRLDGHA